MIPRIGFGFDTHRLEEGHILRIGGVSVPSPRGSLGHSDGDVLIHAIIDALLGAAGLRDIGFHFPDTDEKYRGADSRELLAETLVLIRREGFTIGNLDTTVALQSPRLSEKIPEMKDVLCEILQIDTARLSIKAKTGEKIGFIGRQEGISAYAVVLLISLT